MPNSRRALQLQTFVNATMNCALAISTAAALSVATPGIAAGDPVRGRARAQMCEGCHAIAGYRTAFPEVYSVPRIAGQSEAYLAKCLQDYRTGARKHATMQSIAATLTDQDIDDLAALYAHDRSDK